MQLLAKNFVIYLIFVIFNLDASDAAAQDERLNLYTLLNKVEGQLVTKVFAEELNILLANHGYTKAGSADNVSKLTFLPTLSFDRNVNGGNPSKDLVLGNITFVGDEAFHEKSGFLFGMAFDAKNRQIIGKGRYLSYNLNGAYSYNNVHSIGVATTGANACSINHIANWWYLDVCANASRIGKDLSDNISQNISLVGSHIFEGKPNNYHQASFEINRYFSSRYMQDQLKLGLASIHSNNTSSGIDITLGEAVPNELATRLSISGKLGLKTSNKTLTINVQYDHARGGKLLGYERSDKTFSFSASYPIAKFVNLAFGYQITNSTIDYFDLAHPTFSLQLKPFTF